MALSGKDGVLKVDDAGGVLRDISPDIENVDYSDELAALIATGFGKSAVVRISGLTDAKLSVSGFYNSAATTGSFTVLKSHPAAGATRSFEFGPEGSASGKPRIKGECFRTSLRLGAKVDDKVTLSAEFECSDTITIDTWP